MAINKKIKKNILAKNNNYEMKSNKDDWQDPIFGKQWKKIDNEINNLGNLKK